MSIIKLKFVDTYYFKYIILGLSSSLWVLGFPPWNLFFLSPVAIVVNLLIYQSSKSWKDSLLMALITSLAVCLTGFYWLFYAILYIHDNLIIAGSIWFGFALLYLFIWLPSIFLMRLLSGIPLSIAALISLIVCEIMKYSFLGGFPWYTYAMLWDFDIYMLQIVSVVSRVGLSFLTILLISTIFLLMDKKLRMSTRVMIGSSWILLILFIHFWGYMRIQNFDSIMDNKYIKVRIVQPNINQETKLDGSFKEVTLRKTVDLMLQDLNIVDYPDYIILPETALPWLLVNDDTNLLRYISKDLADNVTVLLGLDRVDKGKFYNSFYAISGADGHIIDTYDKVRLVPFAEYIPLSGVYSKLSSVMSILDFNPNQFTAGYYKNIDLGNISFIPSLCFEGVFMSLSYYQKESDLIINIGNEAWFNESVEFKQSLALFRLLAIEIGRPAIKVANTGISGAFDALGREIVIIPPFTTQVVDISLSLRKNHTIFSNIAMQARLLYYALL